MDFSDEQEMMRKAVKDFVEKEVAPHASEWDAKDTCPVDVLRKMGGLGFL